VIENPNVWRGGVCQDCVWQSLVWVPRFAINEPDSQGFFPSPSLSIVTIAASFFRRSPYLKLTESLQAESSADCVAEFEFLLTVSQNARRSTPPISIVAFAASAASLARSSPLWPDFRFPRIHTRFISSPPGPLELTVLLQAENSAGCVAEFEFLLTVSQNAHRSNKPIPKYFYRRHCRLSVCARIVLSLPEFLELSWSLRKYFFRLSNNYN